MDKRILHEAVAIELRLVDGGVELFALSGSVQTAAGLEEEGVRESVGWVVLVEQLEEEEEGLVGVRAFGVRSKKSV